MPILPNWLPPEQDEHLCSYLFRLSRINGFDSIWDFLKYHVIGETVLLHYDIAHLIVPIQICLSGNKSFNALTMTSVGFYFSLLSPQKQVVVIENMSGVKYSRDNLSFLAPEKIKCCPECMKTRPYCLRAHQLPGVTVCHEHGCALITYDCKAKNVVTAPLRHVERVASRGIEYAQFCKDYLDAEIACNCFDLHKMIMSRMTFYSAKDIISVLTEQGNNKRTIQNFITSCSPEKYFKNPVITMCLLKFLFKDVETLLQCFAKMYNKPICFSLVDILRDAGIKKKRMVLDFKDKNTSCFSSLRSRYNNVVSEITDDEYSIVGKRGSVEEKKISILHRSCRRIASYEPKSFLLNGDRCPYCDL